MLLGIIIGLGAGLVIGISIMCILAVAKEEKIIKTNEELML